MTVTHDRQVSWLRTLIAETVTDASLLVIAFGLFFLAVRRTAAPRCLPYPRGSQAIGRPSRRLTFQSERSEIY